MAQPTPPAHPVKDVEARLSQEKKKAQALKSEVKKIESELKSQKKDIISIARKVKKNEQDLILLERRITTQKAEQVKIEERFNQDRGSIADLVLGLERMRRIPPEAMIARPGAPLETAQSAMLLQSILPNIYGRAEALKADLDKLNTIITDLETHQKEAQATAKTLKKNQDKLTTLMNSREKKYARATKNVKTQQVALNKIAKEAVTLKDLMAKLEKKQQAENKRRKAQIARAKKATQDSKAKVQQASVSAAKTYKKTPIPKAGAAQLPISGLIKVNYGARDDIGAVSKGLNIEGLAGAIVVAPMGGLIEYAGPFRGYGNLIIIKHQNKYHSLVAGLERISTDVGRAVSAGEPLGYMNNLDSDGNKPSLYYELRYNGHPVNPSKKISGLR